MLPLLCKLWLCMACLPAALNSPLLCTPSALMLNSLLVTTLPELSNCWLTKLRFSTALMLPLPLSMIRSGLPWMLKALLLLIKPPWFWRWLPTWSGKASMLTTRPPRLSKLALFKLMWLASMPPLAVKLFWLLTSWACILMLLAKMWPPSLFNAACKPKSTVSPACKEPWLTSKLLAVMLALFLA